MPAPYYVDDGRQTYTRATLAEADQLATRLTMKNAANGSPDKAHVFRPHDVGEYCECGDCDPHAYADQPEREDCPDCWGVGELAPMVTCPRCGGTGYRPSPDWEAIAQAMSDKE